ncbi:MAG: LysR family transcriptional regulator [Burkholderiaceae bacterium]
MSSHAQDRFALMQTFIRIVEAGSLSAAAAQLNLSQPTVSRRLQTLERQLGLRLLQRSTHALSLTESGARCFERAKTLIDGLESLESELRGARDEPEGLLRVVAPHALGQLQLMEPLVALLRRAPRLTVEWLLDDLPPQFIAQGIDCAIRVGGPLDPAAVALKLCEIPRIAVAAPALLAAHARPHSPDDLAALDWLAFGTFYRNELSLLGPDGQRHKLAIRPRLITDSIFALRNATVAGLGAALISAWAVREDLAAGRLVQLLPDWRAPALPVHLVYPYQGFYPAKLRHFVDAMRDSLREPLWPGGAMLPA